jgi:hypothetical protein
MNTMTIDDLIRDLILEDQFKKKYTKRQRSIFHKNMYTKISAFLKAKEDELSETQKNLKTYQTAYKRLLKLTSKHIMVELLYSIFYIMIQAYFYYSLYHYFTKSWHSSQSPKRLQIA